MVGNAAEEGLMTQLDNPSHLDRSRITVPASIVCGLLVGHFVWRVVTPSSFFIPILVASAVCAAVAWRLSSWFARRDEAARTAQLEAARAIQIAETERRLAEMRKDS